MAKAKSTTRQYQHEDLREFFVHRPWFRGGLLSEQDYLDLRARALTLRTGRTRYLSAFRDGYLACQRGTNK